MVVVKEVRLSALSAKDRLEATKEADVLKSLRHPNIVRYVASFTERGCFYIVMEFADGGDLSQKIQRRGRKYFSEDEVLHDFIQLALAIKYIHDRKILHRDLKTQNIFMTKDGRVKLGDFGIARVLERTFQLCRTQIGTPYYLSPEICEGKNYNSKTDIWSLGCILYELCTLKHAFEGCNMNGLLVNIVRGKFAPIPAQYYSKDLRSLVDAMLTKDPQFRPTINQILTTPFVKARLASLLDKTLLEYEFNHTILHGRKPLAVPTIVLSKNDDSSEQPAPGPKPQQPGVPDKQSAPPDPPPPTDNRQQGARQPAGQQHGPSQLDRQPPRLSPSPPGPGRPQVRPAQPPPGPGARPCPQPQVPAGQQPRPAPPGERLPRALPSNVDPRYLRMVPRNPGAPRNAADEQRRQQFPGEAQQKKQQEAQQCQRKQLEDAGRRQKDAELQRQQQLEEDRRRREQEHQRQQQLEEDAQIQRQIEEDDRRKRESEQQRRRLADAEERRRKEAELQRQKEIEYEEQRRREAELQRQKDIEEERRRWLREEEERRRREQEERQQRNEEEKQRREEERQRDREEQRRIAQAREDARQKRLEEERRLAEEAKNRKRAEHQRECEEEEQIGRGEAHQLRVLLPDLPQHLDRLCRVAAVEIGKGI
jgi:NIMA (never in mitosis gene a)-related kinase